MRCATSKVSTYTQLLISAQRFVPVFCRTGSAHLAEYASKVLLGFEAAGDGNIQDAHFGGTQHFLRSLDPIPLKTLVRSLAGRVAEDLRKVRALSPTVRAISSRLISS